MAPSVFGKYEVIELIGQGGFGRVFKAYDPTLKRHVAVKTLALNDPETLQRFEREAEIAAKLRHPSIVTVYDYGEQDGEPYLVQEFLDGEDLHHRLARGEAHDFEQVLGWLTAVAEGLEHAHGHGVLHRDVKPSNIRILDNGEVRVMDFGIAKLMEEEQKLTRTGMSIGTAGYMAPEQLQASRIDHRVDIFSFGAMAYELIAGTSPFQAGSFSATIVRILNEDPPPLASVVPSCDPRLVALIEQCLKKSPDERIASFAEVAERLRGIARQPAVTGPPAASLRRRVLHPAMIGVLLGIVPVAGWLAHEQFGPLFAVEPDAEPDVLDVATPNDLVDEPIDPDPVDAPIGPDPSVAADDEVREAPEPVDADIADASATDVADAPAPASEVSETDAPVADAPPEVALATLPDPPAATIPEPSAPTLVPTRIALLMGGSVRGALDAAEATLARELLAGGYDVRDATLVGDGAESMQTSFVLRAGEEAGAGTVIHAEVNASSRPVTPGIWSGSAAVTLRLYDIAASRLLASERFEVGSAQRPGQPGPTPDAAEAAAAEAAALQAARAALRALERARSG